MGTTQMPQTPQTHQAQPLRIGLIGAGWVTQHHLAGWRQHASRARVVSITDPHTAQAQARASAFGIDQVFANAEHMLDRGDLDAVDVAAPRETHAELVRLAARHGLPVLCQKPLAPTYEEACTLVAETQDCTRLMVHENWRFRPYYRQISRWLHEQRIGQVVQAQMSLLTSGLIADGQGRYAALDRQPFVATLQRALVMEILIHHIDTLRFLLGDLRLVHARLGKGCSAMAGEDRASLVFESTSGAAVSLLANLRVWGEPEAKPDELLLVGERGCIRLSGDSLRCQGDQPEQLNYDLPACYTESYAATIGHFIDALGDGGPFETSPQDNLQTLRLVEEIYNFSRI
ncbi:Gfo/Idh/MocA family protein [Hydrogenophaga sp.]|uniref:Gfo/Idh/MocA family protein n=1 Tax=Hydrogenophaga sp. TaxID=1904254 RepID=UPI002FC60C4D